MRYIALAAVIALLAFVGHAAANPSITVECPVPGSPTASFTEVGYPDGVPVTTEYQAVMNGVPFASGTVEFTGPTSPSVDLGALPEATGSLTVFVSYWSQRFSAQANVNCPPAPPPPPVTPPPVNHPPPPPVTPPVTPPARVIDCNWVTTHYAPRLRQAVARKLGLNCGFTKPKPKPKPPLNCNDLLDRGAGVLWYDKLGFPRFCHVIPAVTG